MSPIAGIRGSIVSAADRAPRETAAASRDARTRESRALIPLQPIERAETPLRTRPQAAFLAHLLATRDKLPQTRERRRAEPEQAVAVYAAADADPAAPSGVTLSRVM